MNVNWTLIIEHTNANLQFRLCRKPFNGLPLSILIIIINRIDEARRKFQKFKAKHSNKEMKNLNVFYILYSIFEREIANMQRWSIPEGTWFLSSSRYRTIQKRGGSCLDRKRNELVLVVFGDERSRGICGPPIGRTSRRRKESERSRQVTRNWFVAREFPARKKRMKEGRRRYGDADGDFMLNGLDSGMRALDGLPSPRFLPSCSPQSGSSVVVFSEQVPSEDPCRLKLRWR